MRPDLRYIYAFIALGLPLTCALRANAQLGDRTIRRTLPGWVSWTSHFSGGGRFLCLDVYVGQENKSRDYLYDLKTGRLRCLPEADYIAVSPHDQRIATSAYAYWPNQLCTVKVLDSRNLRVLATARCRGYPNGLEFSPNGYATAWAQSDSEDGSRHGIYVWQYRGGSPRLLSRWASDLQRRTLPGLNHIDVQLLAWRPKIGILIWVGMSSTVDAPNGWEGLCCVDPDKGTLIAKPFKGVAKGSWVLPDGTLADWYNQGLADPNEGNIRIYRRDLRNGQRTGTMFSHRGALALDEGDLGLTCARHSMRFLVYGAAGSHRHRYDPYHVYGWVVDVPSRRKQLVLRATVPSHGDENHEPDFWAALSPDGHRIAYATGKRQNLVVIRSIP